MTNQIIRAILVMAALVAVLVLMLRYAFYPPLPGQPDIAHAGGSIAGLTYTESIAALDASYAAGFRRLEIDLRRTSDERFVCSHDWDAFGGEAPDHDAFLEWRRSLQYPPCTLEELVAWFDAHLDATLYADAKDAPIAAAILLQDRLGSRLIVDAAEPETACAFRQAGLESIVFSTYRRAPELGVLMDDLANPCITNGNVIAVAIPIERLITGHAFVARHLASLPVFAHTVDDCISARLFRLLGADALFSERISPHEC